MTKTSRGHPKRKAGGTPPASAHRRPVAPSTEVVADEDMPEVARDFDVDAADEAASIEGAVDDWADIDRTSDHGPDEPAVTTRRRR